MKLQKYIDFVDKLNENKKRTFRTPFSVTGGPVEETPNLPNETEMPGEDNKYDSVADFRKELDMDYDSDMDSDFVDSEPDFFADDEFDEPASDTEYQPSYDDIPNVYSDEQNKDFYPDTSFEETDGAFNSDDEVADMDPMPEDFPTDEESKLEKLASILKTDILDKQIVYGEHVVDHFSETDNLHIGNKQFESAESAARYLKGLKAGWVRDTSEERSYRFRRKMNRR